MPRTLPATVAAVVSLFATGCGPRVEAASEATSETRAPIIAGADSTSADDAVVEVAMRPGGGFAGLCSGTLVAPNLVLTARHCVANTDHTAQCTAEGTALVGAAVYADYAAEELFVYRGPSATADLGADLSGTPTLAAAHGKTLIVEGNTLCNADLAFLVLDHDLPPPYAPVRTSTLASSGESLVAVGYGLDATGNLPSARQRRDDVVVLATGKLGFAGGAGLGDAELLVGESACSGDSGGPLLSPITGAVVGVVSRGGGGDGPAGNAASPCMGSGAHMIYTHLFPKKDLVARAYAAADRKVWREGAANPYDGIPDDAGAPPPDGGTPKADAGADKDAAAPSAKDAGARVTDGGAKDAGRRDAASEGDSDSDSDDAESGEKASERAPSFSCRIDATGATKVADGVSVLLASAALALRARRKRR